RAQARAVVGSGQEDDSTNARLAFEEEHALDLLARVRLDLELSKGSRTEQVPEIIAAIHGEQLRNQAAHAVADENHGVQSRILMLGIDLAAQLCQCLAEVGGAAEVWLRGRREVKPELEMLAQLRIGPQIVAHGPR